MRKRIVLSVALAALVAVDAAALMHCNYEPVLGGIDRAGEADVIALVRVREARIEKKPRYGLFFERLAAGDSFSEAMDWVRDHPGERAVSFLEVESCWFGACPGSIALDEFQPERLPFTAGTRAVAFFRAGPRWSTIASSDGDPDDLGLASAPDEETLRRRVMVWRGVEKRGADSTGALVQAALTGSSAAIGRLAFRHNLERPPTTEELESLADFFIANPPDAREVRWWLQALDGAGEDAVTQAAMIRLRDRYGWPLSREVLEYTGVAERIGGRVPREATTAFLLFGL